MFGAPWTGGPQPPQLREPPPSFDAIDAVDDAAATAAADSSVCQYDHHGQPHYPATVYYYPHALPPHPPHPPPSPESPSSPPPLPQPTMLDGVHYALSHFGAGGAPARRAPPNGDDCDFVLACGTSAPCAYHVAPARREVPIADLLSLPLVPPPPEASSASAAVTSSNRVANRANGTTTTTTTAASAATAAIDRPAARPPPISPPMPPFSWQMPPPSPSPIDDRFGRRRRPAIVAGAASAGAAAAAATATEARAGATSAERRAQSRPRRKTIKAAAVPTEWRQRVVTLVRHRRLTGPFYEDVQLDAHTWTCAVGALNPQTGRIVRVVGDARAAHPVHAPALERAAKQLFVALDDDPTFFCA